MKRFEDKIDTSGDCHIWTATTNTKGYGSFKLNGKMIAAHRFAYELKHGPVPDGFDVLHTCDNRRCLKDEHLFLGTHEDNMTDRNAKGRQAKGESHGRAKITEQIVREIRSSSTTLRLLADKYGLAIGTVGKIKNGQLWAHVS